MKIKHELTDEEKRAAGICTNERWFKTIEVDEPAGEVVGTQTETHEVFDPDKQ